jgi:hypothetical protein
MTRGFCYFVNTNVCCLLHYQNSHPFPPIKLRGLSPRTKYTDRAIAACGRSYCQRLRITGFQVVGVTDPYGRILDFLDRIRYFFFQVALQLYSRGSVDPVPDPLLLRNLVTPRIEHGPLPLTLTRNSDH